MAEIVRTETRVERRWTGDEEARSSTQVRTVVQSQHAGHASMVRDFAAALDAADAPDGTPIRAKKTESGDLIGLVADWTRHVDPPDPPAP